MKLIDKDTLVGEINRLQEATMDKNQNFLSSYHEGIFDGLSMLENFLDTLEVKEIGVDLGDPKGDKSAKHIIDTKTLEVKEVEEPSKDLEEAADNYVGHAPEIDEDLSCFIRRNAFIAGAQWQKERILNVATEREVKVDVGGYPYIDFTELYDFDKDIPLAKEGDKVKLVIVKNLNG